MSEQLSTLKRNKESEGKQQTIQPEFHARIERKADKHQLSECLNPTAFMDQPYKHGSNRRVPKGYTDRPPLKQSHTSPIRIEDIIVNPLRKTEKEEQEEV